MPSAFPRFVRSACGPAALPLLVLGAGALTGGCQTASPAMMAVPVVGSVIRTESVRRQTRVDAIPASGAPMLDAGGGWRREWRGVDGTVIDPTQFRSGDPVVLIWQLPFGVRAGTGGVGVLQDGSCAESTPRPTGVAARYAPDARLDPEVWSVGGAQGTVGVRGAVPEVAALALFHDVRGRMGLPQWLILTPRPGPYALELAWQDTSVARLSRVRPCVVAWTGAPAVALAQATDLADHADGASGDSVVDPETHNGRADAQARVALGLTNEPGYDLILLHDRALSAEVSGAQALSPSLVRLARQSRQHALATLSATPGGRERLCTLSRRRALGGRPLGLWGGEATIPAALTRSCQA